MSSSPTRVFSILALAGLAACGRNGGNTSVTDSAGGMVAAPSASTAEPTPPAASVSNLALGKRIGPDGRVTDTTSVFSPRDTVYATVVTTNASPQTVLVARWMFQNGQLVDSTSQRVAGTQGGSPAVTEFHVSNPQGWPVGRYTVAVMHDGREAATRQFEVRRR